MIAYSLFWEPRNILWIIFNGLIFWIILHQLFKIFKNIYSDKNE